MTLALRCVLVGIFTAVLTDYLLSPNAWVTFLVFMGGMVMGLAVAWFCWPWERGPE